MSFLAHLLGRDRPEAVQPRLPSLFEPPPSAPVFGDLFVAPSRTEEERPAERRLETSAETPRRRAPAPLPPPVAVAPGEEPAAPAPSVPRRRAVAPPEPIRPEPARFARPEAGPDRTVVAAPLPTVERPSLPAAPAAPPRALAPVEPPRPEPVVRVETREIRTREEPARPAPAAPAPVMPPPLAAPLLARPETAGLAPRQERPAERFAAPEPAPVIRVTIGRIEVRAVPSGAAAAAVPPRPAEPRRGSEPSLEEYLKRRSGAGEGRA